MQICADSALRTWSELRCVRKSVPQLDRTHSAECFQVRQLRPTPTSATASLNPHLRDPVTSAHTSTT